MEQINKNETLQADNIEEKEVENETEENTEIVAEAPNKTFKNQELTMWNDVKLMQNAWKMANVMSKTSIVPQAYKDNSGNCLIAIDIANRMGLSPIMVMQNSQVVQGNFTWKGSACKGLIDNCGRFKNTRYIFIGDKGTDDWGCYLEAFDNQSKEIIKGALVDIRMAKDEGWYNKNGSKWKTMPELMLQYRAATFFARANCPQALMGFYTYDEMVDVGKVEDKEVEKIKISMNDE